MRQGNQNYYYYYYWSSNCFLNNHLIRYVLYILEFKEQIRQQFLGGAIFTLQMFKFNDKIKNRTSNYFVQF